MQKTKKSRSLSVLFFVVLAFNLFVIPSSTFGVRAQSAGEAEISPPDTEDYPNFKTNLKIFDFMGMFIHNLKEENIQLLENGIPVEITGVEEIRPGAQLVFALNPGPPFAIQDSQAVSRYDSIVGSLASWGKSRIGTNIDDLSLITSGGATSNHLSNPSDWVTVLTSSQVDPRTAVPSLDTLFRAVSLASDSPVRSGMGKAVLFISPPLEGLLDEPFENIISQALQHDLRINIWMVTSPGTYSAKAAEQLSSLAQETQGNYFLYTGEEEFPDLENYFEPLRNLYTIDYQSKITGSGTHQLQAQVETQTEPVSTFPVDFEFEILPPAPSLITPPLRITRSQQNDNNWSELFSQTEIQLTPSEQTLSIAVDFPDGKQRPLRRSTLYVNGSKVDENSVPPYNSFTWDLSEVNSQGTYQIQVEVEDIFGIRGQSTVVPIEIYLELPEPSLLETIFRNLPTILILFVLLAGSLVFLILVLGGKIKPSTPGVATRIRRRSRKKKSLSAKNGPNEAIKPNQEYPGQKGIGAEQEANAILIPLEDTPNLEETNSILIFTDEISFGSDPKKVNIFIEDASIDKIHARIQKISNEEYRVTDEHTTAGTWVNYERVPWDGQTITHGDVIHFGRIGYLFKLINPSMIRKPVIKTGPTFADLIQPVEHPD